MPNTSRRLSPFFTVFILTVVVGGYITEQILPKSYCATSLIQVDSGQMTSGSVQINPAPYDGTFTQERALLTSPQVLLPVIEDMNLAQSWSRLEGASQGKSLTPEMALKHLLERLRIEVERGTNLIRISVWSRDPKEAADIANDIVNHYMALMLKDGKRSFAHEEELLSQDLKSREAAVKVLRGKLNTLAPSHRDDLPSSPSMDERALIQNDLDDQNGKIEAIKIELIKIRLYVARTSSESIVPRTRIIARAEPASAPLRPNKPLCYTLTFLSAFGLGCMAYFLQSKTPPR